MGQVSFAENIEKVNIIEQDEPVNIYEYQNVPENKSWAGALPMKQGLYDPELEKDACGVGFAA
jgi:glutamate synthase (NADPH/NADH)